VQDRLREYATEVNTILVAGGHFYIYSDTTHMARAANNALAKIIAARRGVDDSEAQSVLKKMRLSRQYQVHFTL
jgi:sulfite reductase alpha subunit-like flavoprotein